MGPQKELSPSHILPFSNSRKQLSAQPIHVTLDQHARESGLFHATLKKDTLLMFISPDSYSELLVEQIFPKMAANWQIGKLANWPKKNVN